MKILVIGANGMLGREVVFQFSRFAEPENMSPEIIAANHSHIDIMNHSHTFKFITKSMPDVIINCAAFTDVDACETLIDKAYSVNASGAKNIAVAGKKIGAKVIHISTDYVFDGTSNTPYTETDIPNPLSVYGKSKLEGELAVRESTNNFAIVRTSRLYGPYGDNFVKRILCLGRQNQSISVVADQIGNPSYSEDLAYALWIIITLNLYGIYHVTNKGSCSWYEWAVKIFEITGHRIDIRPILAKDFTRAAVVPQNASLDCSKYEKASKHKMRPWQETLNDYLTRYLIH